VKPIHGRDQRVWLARLKREYPNLRAALAWGFGPGGDALVGCRLVGVLFHFWYIASEYRAEAQQWITAASRGVRDTMPPAVQAWVWLAAEAYAQNRGPSEERRRRAFELFEAAGDLAHAALAKTFIAEAVYYQRRDYFTTLQLSEEAVAQARELDDDWVLRFNLFMLGQCLRFGQRDTQYAEAVYRESLELSRAKGDWYEVAHMLHLVGGMTQERLQFVEALHYAEQALELARQLGDPFTELQARCEFAENTRYLGDATRAAALLEECLAFTRKRLTQSDSITPLLLLAKAVNEMGDHTQAQALLDEALRLQRSSFPLLYVTYRIMDAMAAVSAACGDALRAARLRGVADHFIYLNHHYRCANHEWEYAPYVAKARAALGDAAYEAAYAEGRAMTPEQAVEYALQGSGR
jgi:tetratricopeptide (TPR) repeat protein